MQYKLVANFGKILALFDKNVCHEKQVGVLYIGNRRVLCQDH